MSELDKIKPLNHSVAAIWEHETSCYPDMIKVPMEDGRVISFRREVELPNPVIPKAIGNIRIGYRYGYVGRHEKK